MPPAAESAPSGAEEIRILSMVLHVHIPGRPLRRIALTRKTVLIGRDTAADVQIDHPDVPDVLCQLQNSRDDRWILRIAGQASQEQELEPDVPVWVGPISLRLRPDSAIETKACPICDAAMPVDAVVCLGCGFDSRSGKRIGHAGLPAAFTPPTADATPTISPAPWPAERGEAPPTTWREFGAAATAVATAILSLTAYGLVHRADEPFRFAAQVVLHWFSNTTLLVAGILLASHWGVLEFGHVHRGVLKCSAVVLLTLAIVVWLPLYLQLVATLIVPFAMIKYFYELDFFELTTVVAVQAMIFFGLTVVLSLLL